MGGWMGRPCLEISVRLETLICPGINLWSQMTFPNSTLWSYMEGQSSGADGGFVCGTGEDRHPG